MVDDGVVCWKDGEPCMPYYQGHRKCLGVGCTMERAPKQMSIVDDYEPGRADTLQRMREIDGTEQ